MLRLFYKELVHSQWVRRLVWEVRSLKHAWKQLNADTSSSQRLHAALNAASPTLGTVESSGVSELLVRAGHQKPAGQVQCLVSESDSADSPH